MQTLFAVCGFISHVWLVNNVADGASFVGMAFMSLLACLCMKPLEYVFRNSEPWSKVDPNKKGKGRSRSGSFSSSSSESSEDERAASKGKTAKKPLPPPPVPPMAGAPPALPPPVAGGARAVRGPTAGAPPALPPPAANAQKLRGGLPSHLLVQTSGAPPPALPPPIAGSQSPATAGAPPASAPPPIDAEKTGDILKRAQAKVAAVGKLNVAVAPRPVTSLPTPPSLDQLKAKSLIVQAELDRAVTVEVHQMEKERQMARLSEMKQARDAGVLPKKAPAVAPPLPPIATTKIGQRHQDPLDFSPGRSASRDKSEPFDTAWGSAKVASAKFPKKYRVATTIVLFATLLLGHVYLALRSSSGFSDALMQFALYFGVSVIVWEPLATVVMMKLCKKKAAHEKEIDDFGQYVFFSFVLLSSLSFFLSFSLSFFLAHQITRSINHTHSCHSPLRPMVRGSMEKSKSRSVRKDSVQLSGNDSFKGIVAN